MINTFLTLILIVSISGYSILSKKILFYKDSENVKILNNFDIFLGIFFLTFLALILNLVIPLRFFTLPIFIFGILLFILFFKRTHFNFSFIYLLIVIVFFNLITNINPLATDSHTYHLQIIKWYNSHKITLGLSNVETRYGMNSSWHFLLSLLFFNFKNSNTIYLLNLVPMIFITNEVFCIKKKDIYKFSNKFLISCVFFILIFSLIHPALNSPILNLLGSPEVDTVGMVLSILCFFYFLKIYEHHNRLNFLYFLVIITLCVTVKLSYLTCIVLGFSILIFFKELLIKNYKLIFIFILFNFFWVMHSYLNSGCFIFGVKKLCVNNYWSINSDTINFYIDSMVTSFVRSKNNPIVFTDTEYYLNSLNWVLPLIKNYMLKSAFFIIILSILTSSLLLIWINKSLLKKTFDIDKKIYLTILILFIFSILVWSKAPEFRYILGIFISVASFVFTFSISFYQNIIYKYFKYINHFLLMIFALMVIKNFNLILEKPNLFEKSRIFNYENFRYLFKINDYYFYYPEGTCALFEKVCIYRVENDLKIDNKKGYLIISTLKD